MANTGAQNELFSSLISDIKTYTGKDPLLPWLRGIRKMTDSLPPQLLREKLPRFLQKCAQTFETDMRYSNDLRYLRVWLKLMDFVDDPGALLKTMKANHIGNKKSLFYQAYALYYEKLKKFEEAEKMYHLGVQNVAEPVDELQKSFEKFLHRMELHRNKRIQRQGGRTTNIKGNSEKMVVKGPLESLLNENQPETQPKSQNIVEKKVLAQSSENEMPKKDCNSKGLTGNVGHKSGSKQQYRIEAESDGRGGVCSDDTVIVKFTKTAIVGKSKAEYACHHGLVEPTVNTKEAMDAINSMFREPLGPESFGKGSRRSKTNADRSLKNEFNVFIDNKPDSGVQSSNQSQPLKEPFQIYCDDEETDEVEERIQERDNFEQKKAQKMTEGAFVFPRPKDIPLKCSEDLDLERPPQSKFREDTVVFRFVGSTISDEPKVENACHHGLVEPTVNLKEAMDDINNMFGKPIEFVRKRRPRMQDKALDEKRNCNSTFFVLPDDDLDHCQQERKCQPSSSSRNESDLFEQTVCTKEAMDEINKMFGMPLDF